MVSGRACGADSTQDREKERSGRTAFAGRELVGGRACGADSTQESSVSPREAEMSSTTPVSAVMTSEVVTVRPDQTLAEAADVLADHGIGAAPVVDGAGRLVGLLRDEDLLISESRLHLPTVISILPGIDITLPGAARRYDEELQQAIASTVQGVMEEKFVSLPPDASLEDLATAMHESEVTHVPIVVDGQVVGIATRGDIVRHLAATTRSELHDRTLPTRVGRDRSRRHAGEHAGDPRGGGSRRGHGSREGRRLRARRGAGGTGGARGRRGVDRRRPGRRGDHPARGWDRRADPRARPSPRPMPPARSWPRASRPSCTPRRVSTTWRRRSRRAAGRTRSPVHLKVDTGMHRVGCTPDDARAAGRRDRRTGRAGARRGVHAPRRRRRARRPVHAPAARPVRRAARRARRGRASTWGSATPRTRPGSCAFPGCDATTSFGPGSRSTASRPTAEPRRIGSPCTRRCRSRRGCPT